MSGGKHVLVVGSLNADLVMRTPKLPLPGETVLGGSFQIVAGGKGANQAVAAARLGAAVKMIGRVGDDQFGALLRRELQTANVDASGVCTDREAPTGTATVLVDAAGQNSIVVASGCNARLSASDIAADAEQFAHAAFLVLQLEIPLETNFAAVAAAHAHGVPVILNAAPAQALPAAFVAAADWLVVNEVEAMQLSGATLHSRDDAQAAAARLRHSGQRVIVTLGAAGAVVVGDAGAWHYPAPAIDVVDTVAAGDAFVGALAAALHAGADDHEALRYAVIAGSLACTKEGAIPSLPGAAAVESWRKANLGGEISIGSHELLP